MRVKLQPPTATDLAPFNPMLPPANVSQIMLLANPTKVTSSFYSTATTDVNIPSVVLCSLIHPGHMREGEASPSPTLSGGEVDRYIISLSRRAYD